MNDSLPPRGAHDASRIASPDLLKARYANGQPPLPGGEVIDLLLSHRSCRAYTDEKLPAGMVETLVAAAQSASTSSNLQSWSVVAVEDKQRRAQLSALARNEPQIRDAPLTLCFVADLARMASIADSIEHRREALDYFESFLVAAIDAGLAAQNACVAAESFGLGTCYLGVMRNRPVEVAEFLKLPPMAVVVFGLSVGWPNPARMAEIKPRLPQASVLHRESYDAAAALAPVAAYESDLAAFNQRARNGQPPWRWRSSGRVAGPEVLEGRDRMAEILRALGFALK